MHSAPFGPRCAERAAPPTRSRARIGTKRGRGRWVAAGGCRSWISTHREEGRGSRLGTSPAIARARRTVDERRTEPGSLDATRSADRGGSEPKRTGSTSFTRRRARYRARPFGIEQPPDLARARRPVKSLADTLSRLATSPRSCPYRPRTLDAASSAARHVEANARPTSLASGRDDREHRSRRSSGHRCFRTPSR
jgi:hypothetical protein